MGLDMYLSEDKYIGANYEHRKVYGDINITINGEKVDIPFNKVINIILQVAYWRKANQIMGWFTRHPNWDENRQEVELKGEDLLALVDLCKTVIADHSKAQELLPTIEGFFFGGTEYDEYYFEDLQDTINMLKDVNPSIYYKFEASW